MIDGRKRAASTIAALAVTALATPVLVAGPTSAEPDIDSVQARVQRLYREAEQASERYNEVRLDLQKSRTRLRSLRSDLKQERHKVELTRERVAASVVDQYQGQTLSSTSRVLLADDPDQFLSQMATISAFDQQQSEMMVAFKEQADRLEKREDAAQHQVAKIAKAKRTLAEKKAEIHEKAGEAKELLDRLKAERRARIAAARAASRAAERTAPGAAETTTDGSSAEEPAPSASAPVSGSAGAAVQFALAQVGDAYVYGAAGPDAYDCSGLTMSAWAAAGVSLPHSSTAQMSSGTSVSISALQPGDLVFYYSPVSHVGMYIGGGQIVHAANPSTGVAVAPVDSMPIAGAVRPG